MAEGGYDPTTENENPALDIALDNDDDDDDTTLPPGTPGATSTPYPPGAAYHHVEEHEMTRLPQEETGVVEGPGESAWNALKGIFPNASATEVEAYLDPTSKRLMVKKAGADQTAYALYTKEKATGLYRLNPKIPPVLRASLGLKTGTKAVRQGLKTIGQKLGSLLPGLIGSIVSFIFKAAGQVLSFLGEHAWLLILAVVAFFMERLLKKRRT